MSQYDFLVKLDFLLFSVHIFRTVRMMDLDVCILFLFGLQRNTNLGKICDQSDDRGVGVGVMSHGGCPETAVKIQQRGLEDFPNSFETFLPVPPTEYIL